MKTPKISIIIALDNHSHPEQTLPTLLSQTATKDMEVHIVNSIGNKLWPKAVANMSATHKAAIGLRYYSIKPGGRAAAWNYGVGRAKTKIIVLLADDFLATPSFVAAHLEFHRLHPAEGAVGIGPTVFSKHNKLTPFMRWLEDSGKLFGVSYTTQKTIPSNYFWGANVSFKKSFFNKAGGFDEDFPHHAWEDYELGIRMCELGIKSKLVPGALTYHDHIVSMRGRKRSMRQAGESAVIFERKHPGSWPWQQKVSIHPLKYFLLAQHMRLKFVLTGSKTSRNKYYQFKMDDAFVRAYKRKQKKL